MTLTGSHPSAGAPRPSVPLVQHLMPLAIGTVIVVILIAIGLTNFMLFHTLAEMISIAVALSVFMVVWNAREHTQNDLALILGIAHLSTAILDMLHTLTYPGVEVLTTSIPDLSKQLWVAARYLQGFATLAAVGFGSRGRGAFLRAEAGRPRIVLGIFALITAVLLWLIFSGLFPACEIEGSGHTPFKQGSEILIAFVLVASALWLRRKGGGLDAQIRDVLLVSILAMAITDLSFAFRNDPYHTASLIGHLANVVAVFGLYQVVVHTGITQPYAFLSQELRASESRLKSIFRVAPTGIGVVRDRILYEVNERVCQMTGYREDELVGKSARILYPTPTDFDFVGSEKYDQISRTGTGSVETHWQRKDGTIINVLLASTPLDPADPGKGVIFTALDISQRDQLLATVRDQAQRMQTVLDTVPEGVLMVQVDGTILLADSVAAQDLPHIAILDPDGRLLALGARPLADLLASTPNELWHEFTAGARTFEVASRPITAAQEAGRYVVVYRDVTRERQIEAELLERERLAAVGQLAAGIAHDFNNILAVIMLYAQMSIELRDAPEQLRAHSKIVINEAQRGAHLVEQIVDFGRRTMLERQPLNLTTLLEEHVAILRRTLPENIAIDLQVPEGSLFVNGDSGRLSQLVTNLAVNARDAMPNGGVLTIALVPAEVTPTDSVSDLSVPPGVWAKLVVSDTGTGMSAEVREHLYEPFFTTKPPGMGSGLGLAQVYGIVKQHEGHIHVESEPGKGTAFSIYLPPISGTALGQAEAPAHHLQQGRGETVLIVEDSAVLRQAVADTLEDLGYRTMVAANGNEALALIDQHRDEVAVILSDMVMPEMGGIALRNALVRQGIRIPLIMMTGHPLDQETEALQHQGIVTILRKPIEIEKLTDALRLALAV